MCRSLLAAFGLSLAVSGCCAPTYPLDTMRAKNLRTPWNTVDYFRYAVRLGDWDAVWEVLSPRSQEYFEEKIGRFAFSTFAGGFNYRRLDKDAPPEVADLALAELIHRSEVTQIRADDVEPEKIWRVQLYYRPIPPSRTNFPLMNAAPPGDTARWTVGLAEWIEGR